MNDDQIRQVLSQAVVTVDDRAEARERLQRRLRRARQRRRAMQLAVAALGIVVVVGAASLVSPALRVPVIGQRPTGLVEVSTACGNFEVTATAAAYLRRWVQPDAVAVDEPCVLIADAAPAPDFDTDSLGPEQPLLLQPQRAAAMFNDAGPGRSGLPPDRADRYPVVLLGTNPVRDTSTRFDRATNLLWWNQPRPDMTWWCVGSVNGGRGCGPFSRGFFGAAIDQYGRAEVVAFVPEATAAAQFRIDDEPVAWQRPRGQVVWFGFDDPDRAVTLRIVAHDASGAVIAEYERPFTQP